MEFKVVDNNSILLNICSNIEECRDKEQVYLARGLLLEDNRTIELKEVQELDSFITYASEDRVQIDKKFLLASMKSFAKKNYVYVLLHTHPISKSGKNVKFSPIDEVFEESLVNLSKKVDYQLPIVFIVMDSDSYSIRIYDNDEKLENISIDFGYEHVSCDYSNLRIIFDDEIGVLYYVPTNSLAKVSSNVAEKLAEIQKKYENNSLSIMDKIAFKSLISRYFGNEQLIRMETNERFDMLKRIEKLEIMIQTGCNLNCKYCYADGGTYGYNHMFITPQKGKEYIESLVIGKIEHIEEITFFGGEPTLYPNTIKAICDTCRDLRNKGYLDIIPFFTMVTNGTLYSDLLAQTILEYDIKLTISIDGPKIINDGLRIYKDGSGSFDTIKDNLKRFRQYGIEPILVEATYTNIHEDMKYTREDIEKYIYDEFGIKNVFISDCTGIEYEPKKNNFTQKYKKGIINFFANHCDEDNISVYSYCLRCINILRNNKKTYSFHCSVGANNITLMCDGRLFPCHRFVSENTYCLGNIIEGILDLSKYQEVYDRLYSYDKNNLDCCKKCWARLLCNTCTWDIISQQKRIKNNFEFNEGCSARKELLTTFMLSFIKTKTNKYLLSDFKDRYKNVENYKSCNVERKIQ